MPAKLAAYGGVLMSASVHAPMLSISAILPWEANSTNMSRKHNFWMSDVEFLALVRTKTHG